MACLRNFLKFQFQKIFFFICKITSQTRKHFSESQFQNSEICSIQEIESHLISKPERFFLNYNFSVHGALCVNQTSSIASCLMSGWPSVKNPPWDVRLLDDCGPSQWAQGSWLLPCNCVSLEAATSPLSMSTGTAVAQFSNALFFVENDAKFDESDSFKQWRDEKKSVVHKGDKG